MTTDHELLQRYARDRAEDAFATLVERHLPLVYGTALRRLAGDAHLAQDVAQGVFVDLARKAASLGPRETLAGWLYFATHRAAAQAVRTEQRRRTREQKAHAMQLHLAEGSADWEQARPVLDAALQELNESDRDAVLRRFFARQPFSAIGAELRVSEDAARMRVDRALEKLRRALEHRGVTSTHAALATALATSATAAVPAGMAEAVTSAAVAGGSTAVAGAAAGFFAMNTPVIVGSVVLLAAGALVYRHQQLTQAEERVAALTRERDALHAAVRQEKKRAAAAERALSFKPATSPESTKTDRSLLGSSTPPPAEPFVGAKPRVGTGEGFFTLRKTPSDPAEARRQIRATNGKALEQGYAALFRQLNWAPEQRARFIELMLDGQEAGSRLFSSAVMAARKQNPSFDRADQYEIFLATNLQTQKEQEAAARAVFGDAAGDALVHFHATGGVRGVTIQLASALFNSESPLTPQQADQLTDVLAQHAVGPSGRAEIAALDIDAAANHALGLLTTMQVAELRRVAENVRNYAEAERQRNIAPAASIEGRK